MLNRRISLVNRLLKANHSTKTDSLDKYLRECSLYVHYPYCKKLCSYCAFVKYVPEEGKPWTLQEEVLENAMVDEIQASLRDSHVSKITSVYFGGGTPSLARPKLVQKVLEAVHQYISPEDETEVTLEANPSSLPLDKMEEFVSAGVNRLSVGVQSLADSELRLLRRDHSVKEAIQCIENAKSLLPGKVSLDLLFARPYQTLSEWEMELDAAVALCEDHIALYHLTLEPGTPLFKIAKAGSVSFASPDTQAEMYEVAVNRLEASGLRRYEIANFSRYPNSKSKHNLNYWRAGQYLGIGPGAHSRIVPIGNKNLIREERINIPSPDRWLRHVKKEGHGVGKRVLQNTRDILSEYLMTSLRTEEGVKRDMWKIFSENDEEDLEIFLNDTLKHYFEEGFLEYSEGSLRCTKIGFNVVDSIVPDLIHSLNIKYSN